MVQAIGSLLHDDQGLVREYHNPFGFVNCRADGFRGATDFQTQDLINCHVAEIDRIVSTNCQIVRASCALPQYRERPSQRSWTIFNSSRSRWQNPYEQDRNTKITSSKTTQQIVDHTASCLHSAYS